jgi:flavin-dependent dehydrogenase
MFDTDVLVLGGGPAGLAASIAAASRGFSVMVVDAARPPIDKACGEGLMPDSQAAAKRLGITFPLDSCHPFRGILFNDSGSAVESNFPAGTGLGFRRTALHSVLAAHAAAAGVEFNWGHSFSSLADGAVRIGDDLVRARWIVGADGSSSRIRAWAQLDKIRRETRRFGFRQHFRVAPWSDLMEIHWGNGCQFYLTPVAADEICVVLMSRDPHLRLRQALRQFPELEQRLPGHLAITAERGSTAGLRLLNRVTRGNIALVGDASGSVDAITGEGLCLAFQQSEALADALVNGNLNGYAGVHRSLMRRPAMMGGLMLILDRWPALRRRVIPAMSRKPEVFRNLLALHVGDVKLMKTAATAAAFCWGVATR